MYPDILIICSPMECIPPYTLHSILKFAPKSKVILHVSPPIHMDNESLLQKRLNVLEQSTSEYVMFLDSDDAIDFKIPSIDKLKDYDAHVFHCYDMDSRSIVGINSGVSKLFGFHMVICRRDLALKVLQKYQKEDVYRDDVCFMYGILTTAVHIKYYDAPLTMKIGSRVVRYAPKELLNGFRNDIKEVWEDKFRELRKVI